MAYPPQKAAAGRPFSQKRPPAANFYADGSEGASSASLSAGSRPSCKSTP